MTLVCQYSTCDGQRSEQAPPPPAGCHPSEKYPDQENLWSCLGLAKHNMALYSTGQYVCYYISNNSHYTYCDSYYDALSILCLKFSYLSKWSLFAISSLEVDEFLPHKHRSCTTADSHTQHNYHSHKYGGKWTVPCIETKTVATNIVQYNY